MKTRWQARLILSPNKSPLALLPFETDVFTTTKQNVTFQDGMLLSSKGERPSELMGLDALKALKEKQEEVESGK